MTAAREDRRAPFIALAALLVVVAAVGAYVVLSGANGATEPSISRPREEAPVAVSTAEGNAATNVVLGWGRVASSDGWDYFASDSGDRIYRAAAGSTTAELVYEAPDEGAPSYVTGINLCGDRLYFVLSVYHDASTESSVRSVTLSGEDERVVFSPSPEEGIHSIEQLSVYDGTLYAVTLRNEGASQLYEVWEVAGDGTAGSRVAEIESSGTCSLMVTPDRVFYTAATPSEHAGQTDGAVYSLDLAGGEPELVYESAVGMVSSVVLHDDRLYLCEGNYATGESALSSVGTDGSGRTVVSEIPEGMLVSSYVLSGDSAYVALLDSRVAEAGGSILVAPLDGGESHGLELPAELHHLMLYDAGDRLFVMGSTSGVDVGPSLLATVGHDGTGYVELELS